MLYSPISITTDLSSYLPDAVIWPHVRPTCVLELEIPAASLDAGKCVVNCWILRKGVARH